MHEFMTYSRECEGTLGGGPLVRNVSNCTHVIVSLLKASKVTVVWAKCHGAVF